MPREVDLSDEVIVITGGASGLGLLIAEVYGMRGATVAVLDVNDMENTEARGVTYYKCDVGDKEQVVKVAAEIEIDVSSVIEDSCFRTILKSRAAWNPDSSYQQCCYCGWQVTS